MPFIKLVLKVFDRVEAKGKKGCVERYTCGALSMIGVRKTMMKRHTSSILLRSAESPSYS